MADTITTAKTLAVGMEYISTETEKTKTVYLKIPDPKTGLTESTVREYAGKMISGANPILLNPDGEPFDTATAIVTAYTENVQTQELDIGVE